MDEPQLWSTMIAIASALIAIGALVYARSQAQSAKTAAASANKSAKHAEEQVEVARRQFELTEQARRDSLEPYVVFDIAQSSTTPWMLDCVIENVGTTVAMNVRFEFDPPLRSCDDSDSYRIGDTRVITHGIPMLPPGRRLTFSFDSAYERLKSDLENAYTVTVNADGPFGPVKPLVYELRAVPLEDTLHLGTKTVHHGMEALVDIEKHVKNIAYYMKPRRSD